jgi:hypothetical protein
MSRRPSSRSKSLQQVEGEDSFLLLDRIRIGRIQTLTLSMSGSYLDAMSDPPSWTTLTGSGKGTGPPRIRRVSAPVATKGHCRETARRWRTHPRVSVARRRAVSWAAPPDTSSLFLGRRACRRLLGFGGEERRGETEMS